MDGLTTAFQKANAEDGRYTDVCKSAETGPSGSASVTTVCWCGCELKPRVSAIPNWNEYHTQEMDTLLLNVKDQYLREGCVQWWDGWKGNLAKKADP